MSRINIEELNKFKNIDLEKISRKDLGEKGFESIVHYIASLQSLINELVQIEFNINLPEIWVNEIENQIRKINALIEPITSYNFDRDAQNRYALRKRIIEDVKKYYTEYFNGNNNGIIIYSAIKQFSFSSTYKNANNLSSYQKEFNDTLLKINNLYEELKAKSGEATVSDYAKIFENQSEKHSSFTFNWKTRKFGLSEKWLLIGIFTTIIFFCLLLNFSNYFPIEELTSINGIQKMTYNISNIFSRILIVSVLIYLINFSFKQYSINKHLATTNRHRQNALNSYQLFINSLKDDIGNSASIRQTLMIEVAKAIYGQENTGYINEKSGNNLKSPTILDFSKIISKES
jgi:hypothetical protein